MISFLLDGSHWTGPDGIPTLLVQHLMYTFAALAVAAVIAIPLGLYIGHTGRGSVVVAGLANSLRALPTIGLLILLVLIIAPSFPNKLAYLIPASSSWCFSRSLPFSPTRTPEFERSIRLQSTPRGGWDFGRCGS